MGNLRAKLVCSDFMNLPCTNNSKVLSIPDLKGSFDKCMHHVTTTQRKVKSFPVPAPFSSQTTITFLSFHHLFNVLK